MEEQEQAQQIQSEIGLLESLSHPNIVCLLGTQRSAPFFFSLSPSLLLIHLLSRSPRFLPFPLFAARATS
jgi:hypothetical protein